MTPDEWLDRARSDAERRGLPGMLPVLDALYRAIMTLRGNDWHPRAARHEDSRVEDP